MIPPLLRDNAGFRRLWAAQTVSLFGDQVSLIAFPLTAVIALHAGAEQMGYLTAAQMAPNLVLALHAGSWVDRIGRNRAVMIAADVARAIVLCSVPAAYAFGELSMVQLYVVGFAIGVLSLFFRVAAPTLVTSLVERNDYVAANQWTNGSRAMSQVAGPSVAGLLVEAVSGPVAVIVDALSYAGSALFLRRVSLPGPATDAGEGHTGRPHAGQDHAGGGSAPVCGSSGASLSSARRSSPRLSSTCSATRSLL
ncbi:MAG TPA: MFS transporter [Acidimicrobiales bacterium]|nr:MFS transporter [Acidimicrobiales bacterium]